MKQSHDEPGPGHGRPPESGTPTDPESLPLTEAKLELALSAAADVVLEIDLVAGSYTRFGPPIPGVARPDREHDLEPLRDLSHPDDLASFRTALERHLSGRGEPIEHDMRVRSDSGSWRTLRMRGHALGPTGQAPEVLLLALVDITEQRELERRASRAELMTSIGRITRAMTHDLNNIVAILTLNVGMLEDPDRNRDEDPLRIARIGKASELASTLVDRLLLDIDPGTGIGPPMDTTGREPVEGIMTATDDPDDPGAVSTIEQSVGASILVVEDQPDLLASVAAALDRGGYRVVEATGPAEALELVTSLDDLDLLLTDVQLPGMTGLELGDRVLRLRPRAKVLYMSGLLPETVDRSDLGPTNFLSKPFALSDLVGRVAHLLDEDRPPGS